MTKLIYELFIIDIQRADPIRRPTHSLAPTGTGEARLDAERDHQRATHRLSLCPAQGRGQAAGFKL